MTNRTFASQAFLDLYLADRARRHPEVALDLDYLCSSLGWARDELDGTDEQLADTVPAPDGETVPSERGDAQDVVVPRAARTGFEASALGTPASMPRGMGRQHDPEVAQALDWLRHVMAMHASMRLAVDEYAECWARADSLGEGGGSK